MNRANLGITVAGTYSGSTTIAPTSFTTTGLVTVAGVTETITSLTSATLNSKDVSANGSNYVTAAVSGTGTANLSNYRFASGRSTATDNAQNSVVLGQLALTGSIAAGSNSYGSALAAGAVTLTNKAGIDDLTTTVSVNTTGNTSTSGNLRAGSYTGIQSVSALGGTDAGNYTFAGITTGNYSVGKAHATVTANSDLTKTYSGVAQSVSGFTASGLVNNETASVLDGVSASGSGTNAGSYTATVGVGSYSGNYNLSFVNGSMVIAKADATVTANSNTALTYNGFNQTVSGFTASGLQGDEQASVLTGVSASTTNKNAGTYSTTASGTDGNYNLSFVDGSMVIGKAALYYNANNSSFSVGTTPSPLSGTVSGFVNNETQSTATTGTLAWTTSATSASGAGSYAINGSGLLADNYNFSQAVENATALTLTQSVSIVPVVNPPALPSDTSFVKPAPLPQASLPFNVAENINTLPATAAVSADINTLPATAAGSVPSTSLNVTKAFGTSGMLFAQGNGVRLPATYYQSTLADPAQNP